MGSDSPNRISDEVRREVWKRLQDGESPSDIADDDEMPSRKSVYNIKDEMEEKRERQEEMEKDVFRNSNEADRDSIISVLEQAGVGIKQSGEPKAKVAKALNAIDFDSAWDDPHYVADTLVQEASMTREWANRVVRKAYDMPDFPYIDQPGEDDGQHGGRSRQRSRRGRRQQRGQGRSQRGRGGRDRRDRDRDDRNTENSQLRREMKQLRSTVSELAETVTEVAKDDATQETVTVEKDGNVMELPANSPMAYQMMMDDGDGGDDEDFIDKLRAAKETGIIPDPDDFQQDDGDDMFEMLEKAKQLGLIGDDGSESEAEMMAEMMDEMSDKFAEAQANVATQMSAAISELADDDSDSDDDVTIEDLEQWWEEKQKEDELDRLESELSDMKRELRKQNNRHQEMSSDPQEDPDVVKKKIDTQHERDQLQMAQETIEKAPDRIAEGIQGGLLPLLDRMESKSGGGNHPAWSPPVPGQQQPDRPQQAPTQPQQQRTPAQDSGYPDADEGGARGAQDSDADLGEDEPSGVSEEDVGEVRKNLGLDADEQETEADA